MFILRILIKLLILMKSINSIQSDNITHNYELSIEKTTESIQDFFDQQLKQFHKKQQNYINKINVQLRTELLKNMGGETLYTPNYYWSLSFCRMGSTCTSYSTSFPFFILKCNRKSYYLCTTRMT